MVSGYGDDRFYFWYRPTDRGVVRGPCGLPNRHFELFVGGITPQGPARTGGDESGRTASTIASHQIVGWISFCLSVPRL